MIYPDLKLNIPDELGRVHFVGIGGAGMSGIARMLHNAGVHVSGSDRSETSTTETLRDSGITVHIGHAASHAQGADTLVVTGALWQDNPEYQYALAHNIPVLHRAHALTWLTRGKKLVSVAGAHGKTTSTGMIITGLLKLNASPSFVNGGIIESLGVSSDAGDDDLMVIEADESDKSFLLYDTDIALITNVDPEHLDFYGSREAFMQAFVDFANAAGRVVISADDPGALEVAAQLDADKLFTFGKAQDAHLRVTDIETDDLARFTVEYAGEKYDAQLSVYGEYNVLNAVGAVAVLISLGYGISDALRATAQFGGTKRRFELHANVDGVRVFEDYAHHPTEVAALLQSARSVAGDGRVIVIYQPHMFSRTRVFYREFAEVLEKGADFTVVAPIDPVREDPIPGISGEMVTRAFVDQERGKYLPDWQSIVDFMTGFVVPGDILIVTGAGDIYGIIDPLVAALADRGKGR